jgi:hypothetical protein
MTLFRGILLVSNLGFALLMVHVDKGTALLNMACAIVLAVDISIREYYKDKESK